LFLKSDKYDTIFLDPNSERFETKNKVNIILSPSLYWVKKISLPVKSLKKAIPLLPSLFEENIPSGNYSYTAHKIKDEFLIFAYEDRVILDILDKKGIFLKQIGKVYFAQSELLDIKEALKIDEKQSIYVKDGIVVLIPCCWTKEKSYLDVSDIKLSKKHITLKQFGHIVDEKSIYFLIFVLFLFVGIVFGEYLSVLQNISSLQDKKDGLFLKYNLKPTMMQNRSILKSYKTLHLKEVKLRRYISCILSLKLQKQKISLLELKNKILTVEFIGMKNGDEKAIKKIFVSNKMKFKSRFKINSWYVEIEL